MYSFQELKKASKLAAWGGGGQRLAGLGNCATQFFSTAIQGYGRKAGLNLNVFDGDYNQIDAQLLDPGSEVFAFSPDEILLWVATDKIYEEFLDEGIEERATFAERYLEKIKNYWDLIARNGHSRILQMNFTEIDDKALGNYSCKTEISFIYQIRKLNYFLQDAMASRKDVYPVDLLAVQLRLGEEAYYDAPLYYNAKVTVSLNALPYVAKAVSDVLLAMTGRIKKCVVLDLDNTLWGGVIGDDGMGNIEIGELGRGHVFTNFQRWLKQLKERGIILAVCSKNEESAAKEPFEHHEEMVLRLDDISIFVANWEDKASNIRFIQQTLNIGMDSMVFLDDTPFERNLVRSMIPELEVPELPEDPALYLGYLQSCNYFDTASYSGEDAGRTKQYQEEMARVRQQQQFNSVDEYLASLDMVGEVRAFEPVRYARIAQLTQRSNQFNLRTVRYTEDEIQSIAEDERHLSLYFTLRDKFGDHGLVSVVILEKRQDQTLFIDTWLMSCRVLKRGMEEFIVNQLIRTAAENGFATVLGEYIPTPKNAMVKEIYPAMGFTKTGEGKYRIEVSDYQQKKTLIKEDA